MRVLESRNLSSITPGFQSSPVAGLRLPPKPAFILLIYSIQTLPVIYNDRLRRIRLSHNANDTPASRIHDALAKSQE